MRLLKSIIYIVLISIFFVPAKSFAINSDKYDPLQTALALNYAMVSLYKIESYNDIIILRQEYENIINNINLSKIEDEEIVELFTSLMDLDTQTEIYHKNKEFIERKYERKVKNALTDAFSQGIVSVGSSLKYGASPYMAGTAALSSIGSVYFDYRRCLEEYKEQRDESEWRIDAQVLLDLNNIRKDFFKYSWRLIKKYNFPDQWRLTEKQVEEYVDILKDKDLARRLRRLKRLEKSFAAYPPFWFYLGKTLQELGETSEALEYYKHFEEKRKGIFRKDPFLVSAYMNRVVLLDEQANKDKIRAALEKIVENSRNEDWNNFLFAALEYAKLGDYENAKKLIVRNIDNKKEISLNMRILGEFAIARRNPHSLDKLIDQMITNDAVKNEDILYLFGRTNYNIILKKMQDQIFAIKPFIKNHIIGKDDIGISMPMKWLFEDLRPSIEFNGKKFDDPDIKADPKHRLVTCIFREAINSSKFIQEGKEVEITIFLKSKSFPVKVVFLTKRAKGSEGKSTHSKPDEEDKSKGFVSKWTKKLEKNLDKVTKSKQIEFEMAKIVLKDKVFRVKNSEIVYSKD